VLFARVDLMITPITAVAPSLIANPTGSCISAGGMALRDCATAVHGPQDLFGLPACAVPVGRDASGLPVGIQLWGPPGSDDLVLAAAAGLEETLRA
jgi:Asp-tRNA(Asn)/Glu-tRNA(Gln) amidotransferase A subunit family amidase